MAATPRNPVSGGFATSPTLPTATSGLALYNSTFDEYFVAQDGVWRTLDANAALIPAHVSVQMRDAVCLAGGVAMPLNVTSHDWCAGVVQALHDGMALVRWEGDVRGFVGLDDTALYCGTSTPGHMSTTPDPAYNLIRVGRAVSADTLRVHLDQPILV